MIRSIGNAIYSFYVFTTFFISIIPAVIFYLLVSWLPDRPRLRLIYAYNWGWMKLWSFFSRIHLVAEGKDNFDPNQTYVFVSNHCNILDILVLGSRLQTHFKPLIKKQLLKVPLLNVLLAFTCIPIDRSSQESRQRGFLRMIKNLRAQTSILIFPEGTRNRTHMPLTPFYPGAFRLAIAGKVPIVPIVLLNLRRLQPVGTFKAYPGKVIMRILEPISTEGMTEHDAEDLIQGIYDQMEKEIVSSDPLFYVNA